MSSNLLASADWLKVQYNHGYGNLPIPSQRDAEIEGLLRKWLKLDEASRNAALAQAAAEHLFTLLSYGERMACLAVRDGDEEHVFFGLLALGLDSWQFDWRENVIIVALLYDAAQRIGVPPERVFEKAAALLPEEPAEGLRSFLRRSPEDRSLKAFGYVTGADTGGFLYVRTW